MKYYLTEACQNTFVLFDCIDEKKISRSVLKQARQCIENENRDDALILLNGHSKFSSFFVELIVLGLDGQIAEFCGNGARACAAYLFSAYPHFKKQFLKTSHGCHPLSKCNDAVYSVKVPPAKFEWNRKFVTDPEFLKARYDLEYVETGEPHLIIKQFLEDEQLVSIGRELNKQNWLFPYGINVNAWSELKEGELFVKTYERGVQRLTKSCGTGSMACAAFYSPKGTVQVKTPGGQLSVTFSEDKIELTGEGLLTKMKSKLSANGAINRPEKQKTRNQNNL